MKTIFISSIMTMAICLNSMAQNTFPSTGNVGIYETSPSDELEVRSDGGNAYITVARTPKSTSPYGNSGIKFGSGDARIYLPGYPAFGSNTLRFEHSSAMWFLASSFSFGGAPGPGSSGGMFNVNGLGWMKNLVVADYNSPGPGGAYLPSGYRMAVDGKVVCEELLIRNSSNWPDYVFEDSYELKDLEEVESFINENNHLPDVPSASEMEENGIESGEMDKLLLKKIEELTLYMIDLKKENASLKAELNAIK